MYYCYNTTDGLRSQQMALGFAALSLVGVICCLGGIILLPNIGQKVVYIFLLFLTVVYFIFSALGYLMYSRRYLVTEEGLVVKNPFLPETLRPWDTVSEIGICKVHYAPRGCLYLTAIRCVIGVEKNGPRRGYGSWASEFYSMWHLRNVIIIVYADYRVEELQKYYPKEIKDYRWIKRFPHDPE